MEFIALQHRESVDVHFRAMAISWKVDVIGKKD